VTATRFENGGAGKAPLCSATMPAFPDGGVTVFVGAGCTGDGAQSCCAYSPADALDLFLIQ